MRTSVVELTFEARPPKTSREPRVRSARGKVSLKENAGFKYSKSFGSKAQLDVESKSEQSDRSRTCRIEGVSVSKFRSSRSTYLKTDSAVLAQRILEEQEEILGILENSAFLTHSLTRLSAEGLSEQQHFIRAFEEVERAKLRLLFGPYPSRDTGDGEERSADRSDEDDALESQSSLSVDSLDLPSKEQTKRCTPLRSPVPSFELTLREDIFKQMDRLLGSDDEDDGEGGEGGEEESGDLEELQLELKKRIPSRLDFNRAPPSASPAPLRSERYRDISESDEDEEQHAGATPLPPPVIVEQQRARVEGPPPPSARLVGLLLDSLPEWLVMCVRSYRSVFLNNESAAVGTQSQARERSGDDLRSRLERSARKFLQVERYLERLEREVSAVRGRLATEATRPIHGHGGRSLKQSHRERSQKQLMSRSIGHLDQKERPRRVSAMRDDEGVRYASPRERAAETESQAETTVRKGRMLLLSAAISFGDVAGRIIAESVWDECAVR
jgi:hypothetical protein